MTSRAVSTPPVLPGFRFVGVLGTGGFADVFRYEQVGLGRPVAVKVLLRDLGGVALDRFRSEANLMARLSTHPSIVTIHHAAVASDGRPYLVMELCPPPHLGALIRKQPLPVARALDVGVQLAGAVETAHRLGILHRDIKPANILFTEFGRPALTDFGIAHARGDRAAATAYSVAWAPPEQLAHQSMDVTGDVYSLGATVWAMLVGRAPFEVAGGSNDAVSMAARVTSEPVPATGRADVPESLERVLRVAMAKDPERRYGSALEFGRALQGVQAQLHQPVTTVEIRDRVSTFVAVSDHATVLTGAQRSVPDVADTVLAAAVAGRGEPPAQEPRPPGRGRRMAAVAAGLVLLVVAGVSAGMALDVGALLAAARGVNESAVAPQDGTRDLPAPSAATATQEQRTTVARPTVLIPSIAESTRCLDVDLDAIEFAAQVGSASGGDEVVWDVGAAFAALEDRCGVVHASDVAFTVSQRVDLPAEVSSSVASYVTSVLRFSPPAASTVARRIDSPAKNLSCELEASSVGCSILDRDYPPEQDCSERLFSAVIWNGAARTACGTEWLGKRGEDFYHVSYGETVTYGFVACVVEEEGPRRGVTCWDMRTGNSFLLSRARFEISNDGTPQ